MCFYMIEHLKNKYRFLFNTEIGRESFKIKIKISLNFNTYV